MNAEIENLSESNGRDGVDGHYEKGIGRDRVEYRAGRPAGRDPAGGLLPQLAGIAYITYAARGY